MILIHKRKFLTASPDATEILAYMMTSSNGNIFRVTGPLCGEFTGPGEFPTQRPVTRSFDEFFDLRLNKRLSKQPWGWWFETPSWSLWRQCNEKRRLHQIRSTCPLFLVVSWSIWDRLCCRTKHQYIPFTYTISHIVIMCIVDNELNHRLSVCHTGKWVSGGYNSMLSIYQLHAV